MEKLQKQFEKLGINGKEADVYVELLKLKEATVVQLSKNTAIKRTSVYYCLDALINKGIVGQTNKNSKKLYFVEEPKESLGNLISQQKSALEEMLPQIKDIYGKGNDLPAIKIYYNLSGIKNIFEDAINCKEKIARYYVSDLNIDEMLGETFLKSFVKKRIANKIKSLSLRTENYVPEREMASENQLRETRLMPEGLVFAPYMCIYDNKSVVISAKEKIGFIIESQEFADAQKAIFDTIWNIGKDSTDINGQVPGKATEEDIYY